MARKKQSSAGELILFAIFAVGAFLFAILWTILQGLLTALVVLPPIILAVGVFMLMKQVAPPSLPDIDSYDPDDQAKLLDRRSERFVQTILETHETYSQGDEEGILTRNARSDEAPQFREHSRRGKELNLQLTDLENERVGLERDIQEIVDRVRSEMPDWQTAVHLWRNRVRSKRAFKAAILFYVLGGVIALLATVLIDHTPVTVRPFLLPTLPEPLFLALAVAPCTAGLAWLIARRGSPADLGEVLSSEFLARYEQWDQRWQLPRFDVQSILDDQSRDRTHSYSDEDPSDDESSVEPWADVLGISETASVDEIKGAWREGLKQYHPDRIQQAGPKLRALAEEETKRLNDAYARAMQQRARV